LSYRWPYLLGGCAVNGQNLLIASPMVLFKTACNGPRAIRGQSESGPIVPVQLAMWSARDKVDEGDQNEDRVRPIKVF